MSTFLSQNSEHLSPAIQRIPPEIFSEVAQQAVALGVNPLTLSHVCQSWRANVIGTKKLWNSIAIDWYTGLNLLNLLVNRSEGTNISIVIEQAIQFNLHRLMSTITQYSSSITSLELRVEAGEDQGSIGNLIANLTFQSLSKLVIHLDTWYYTEEYGLFSLTVKQSPDVRRRWLLERLFDLLCGSSEKQLYLQIHGGPLTIRDAFEGHPICDRVTRLDFDINTKTQSNGRRTSEAAQFGRAHLRSSSFPVLTHISCKGFMPILHNLEAPMLIEAKYECNPGWSSRKEWKSFHPNWLNSKIQRLHLRALKLDLGTGSGSFMDLTWLCLDCIRVIGPLKPWLHLPNLHTLIWKLDEKHPGTTEYLGEVLSKDGIFGSLDNLQTLELYSFSFKNEDPHIAQISHQILLHEHLKRLRMENCDIQAEFLEDLLGNQELGHTLFRELEEIFFVRCNLGVPFQDIRSHVSGKLPHLALYCV
ncbi:hypothetical protein CPB86DRAFT_826236 [Serendipita vermifera]|nr:hypothetical protein CPB86DRAFT_826236 [Serendipita vermifera]